VILEGQQRPPPAHAVRIRCGITNHIYKYSINWSAAVSKYDVIVVGSGSAGAALAARLSEDSARSVLLLEAGPDFATVEQTPRDLLDGSAMSMVHHDWRYRAEILDGRRVLYPRGKVTGGSSAVGATIALRGVPRDFEAWAAAGVPQWGWSEVLPYYERLEDDLDFDGEYHGRGGPVPIRRWRPEELTGLQQAFLETSLALGYPEVKDHNHPQATGVGPIPSNRRDAHTRVSTAMAYLTEARRRPNLTIRPESLVHRIVFDGSRATGVEVSGADGGAPELVAAGTVVLSAGALGSPALLMRSGIGPAEELRRHGIDPRLELPGVGRNLSDHPRSGVFMVPRPGAWQRADPFLQTILRTTSAGSDRFNDLQFYAVNHFDLTLFPELQMLGGAPVILGVMVVHQKPQSRGTVLLSCTDPAAAPAVDLNFMAAERDVQVLIDAVRTCWDLVHAGGLRGYGEDFVVLGEKIIKNDAMVLQYVKLSLDSGYHPVGTARMGAAPEDGAVVDGECRVFGAEGLRIADASVMPEIVSCNTNLTSIMIGERVADWIKAG
jgi:choline dehydrogenase